MLVYNTGRPLAYVQDFVNKGMLLPVEYNLCGNGKNIYYHGRLWEPWLAELDRVGYNLNLIDAVEKFLKEINLPTITVHIDREDLSIRWWVACEASLEDCLEAYCSINGQVQDMGNVYIWQYSFSDVKEYYKDPKDWQSVGIEAEMFPAHIKNAKGPSAAFLYEEFQKSNKSLDTGIWAGDSGNDVGMLSIPSFKGIVVANHDEHLGKAVEDAPPGTSIYRARQSFAAGVLEGLQFISRS